MAPKNPNSSLTFARSHLVGWSTQVTD